MRRSAIVVFLASAVALTAQKRAPELESIRQSDMKSDLTFLASDAMAGRLTDTPRLEAEGGFGSWGSARSGSRHDSNGWR